MKHLLIYLLFILCVVSCSWYKTDTPENAVARVEDAYLYLNELESKIPENLSKTDSLIFVQDYINKWAKQQLLVNGATQNLKEEELKEFEMLIDYYRNDLYSNAYLEALVSKSLDTIIKYESAKKYYTNNNQAFNLNENLLQLRYIAINNKRNDIGDLVKRLKRFDSIDRFVLDSLKIQFKSSSLNDSIWIKSDQVLKKLPVFTTQNNQELLKKSNFLQLTDSLDLYLVQIKNVLLRGETAPLSYVRPTINQILINKRKVDLLKKIETDITKDAIKNKQFEILN
ncbi:peptidyl-prolyl cis-trans isomerase [Aurantibacter sp.]|uniref:peptidyl-prolyl cis-trans isomerase n=1 Tax=Aurantibacter sp. TaxID=2807103 RepID=UPI0035C7EFE0